MNGSENYTYILAHACPFIQRCEGQIKGVEQASSRVTKNFIEDYVVSGAPS